MSVSIIEWSYLRWPVGPSDYLRQLNEQRPAGGVELEADLRVLKRGKNVFASGRPIKPEAVRLLDEFLDDPALFEKLQQPESRAAVLLFRVHALQHGDGPADFNPQPEARAA